MDAQTTVTFWSTHNLPLNKAIFLFIVGRVLVKPVVVFIKRSMSTLRQPIKTHEKHQKRRKARVDEENFARNHVPTLRRNPIANLKNRRQKIFHTHFRRSNRDPLIFEGEGAHFTIKKIRNTDGFLLET